MLGGDENSPTTQATGAQGAGGGANERIGGPRTAALPRPQWGMAADDGSAGNPPRHTAGTDVSRPEHGALAHRKYSLLEPIGIAVDPADADDPGSEAGHGATVDQDGRAPEERDETQQCKLPACCRNGIGYEGRGPPKRSCTLNASGHQGGERGGGPPIQQHVHTARIKRLGGDSLTRHCGPHHVAMIKRRKGPPPTQQCEQPAHGQE